MTKRYIMLVRNRGVLRPGDKVLLRYPSGIQYVETVDDLTESGDVIWTIGHYLHERKMVLSTDPVEVWIDAENHRTSASAHEDPLSVETVQLQAPQPFFGPFDKAVGPYRAPQPLGATTRIEPLLTTDTPAAGAGHLVEDAIDAKA